MFAKTIGSCSPAARLSLVAYLPQWQTHPKPCTITLYPRITTGWSQSPFKRFQQGKQATQLDRAGKGVLMQQRVVAAGDVMRQKKSTDLTVSLKPLNDPLRSKVLASEALCSAQRFTLLCMIQPMPHALGTGLQKAERLLMTVPAFTSCFLACSTVGR